MDAWQEWTPAINLGAQHAGREVGVGREEVCWWVMYSVVIMYRVECHLISDFTWLHWTDNSGYQWQ